MNIKQICNRNVVVVGLNDSIQEVAQRMREYRVGTAVVVNDDMPWTTPVGIINDHDIVSEVLAEGGNPNAYKVKDIMSNEILTVQEEDDILEALPLLHKKGMKRIPVVNRANILTGILALEDLVDLVTQNIRTFSALTLRPLQYETVYRV
ncbi:MAG: CBS domain-containing protein [Deltaproteobacteria bacterium]|nr:CBS domain-containing protein [Deltaproteobacteria bacterium]